MDPVARAAESESESVVFPGVGVGAVLDFSFRVLVPESKMIQAGRAKFTNVRVPTLIFLDQWILL